MSWSWNLKKKLIKLIKSKNKFEYQLKITLKGIWNLKTKLKQENEGIKMKFKIMGWCLEWFFIWNDSSYRMIPIILNVIKETRL